MISITVKSNGDGTYWIKDGKKQISKTMSEMTREEAYKFLKSEVRKVNRRISNIQGRGLYSPAVEGIKRWGGNNVLTVGKGGRISLHSKGKNIADIFNSIIHVENFLSLDTSSVRGTLNYKKDVENRLGLKNVSSKTLSVIWRLINRAKEVNPVIANYASLGKYVYNLISNEVPNISDIDEMEESEIDNMIEEQAGNVMEKIKDIYYKTIGGLK